MPPPPDPVAIVIGPKGRGSNMTALAKACQEGRIPARISVVISPVDETAAVTTARALGLKVDLVPSEPLESYGDRLLQSLRGAEAKWICLAGYLRLLPASVLREFPNRVLNIHPALLPKFGGKGMYGMRVHEAVAQSEEKETGCTVHFVNERYDDGAIILQRRVPRFPSDTPQDIAHRVLEQEHIAYAEALAIVIHDSRA